MQDYHRPQLKTRSQKNAESLQELVTDIERLTLVAYPDYLPDVRNSFALNSFVDAVRDPEIQQALRIADHKDLRSAVVYAIKFKSAQQASKKPKFVREAVIKDSTLGPRTEDKDKLENVIDVLRNLQSSIESKNI